MNNGGRSFMRAKKKKADDEEVYTIEEPSFIPCINEITNYGSLISNNVHNVQDP